MGKARVSGWAVTLALLTAACSSQLPASGPTSEAILDRANSPDASVNFNYVLIDVTDPVINALATRPIQSLEKTFGVGGPAPLQVIRVGDEVGVEIWETGTSGPFSTAPPNTSSGSPPALIPQQEVSTDGMISVPYVGRIRVVGLKPGDVERLIVKGLAGKAIEPQAVVTVTHSGNTVSVGGEGTGGKRVLLTPEGERVLDVIADAGGLKIPANQAWVRLTRGQRTVSIPYLSILAKPSENVYVRSGDDVTVVQKPQTFTVLGATTQNSQIQFNADTVTLEEAVAKAGGLQDLKADPQGVFLFRFEPAALVGMMLGDPSRNFGTPMVPVVYRLNFRDASSYFLAREFDVRDKDIVYVSDHPLADMQKYLSILYGAIAPPAQAAATGYLLAR